MVLDETADIGLATESLSDFADLVSLPCYEWQHVVVMPATHPLAQVPRLTLEQLASEPLISYHPSFTGRKRIDQAFAQRGLTPNVVLEAIDADVIKTYTRLGLGIGLVAEMAVKDDPLMSTPGSELVWRPVGHLFGPNMARLAFKRGAYLRQFVLAFAELTSDRLSRALIMQALQSPGQGGHTESSDYGL
jgi:LysR family cys regulon transcriptional activator